MRAAVLTEFGQPLAVREVPDPSAGGGEVLVEVMAAGVLPYSAEVFGGARSYPLEPPVIPGVGAVARVLRTGPDATSLRAGDVVWCDPTVRSRDGGVLGDITLQGWSSRGEGGLLLSRHFHDGTWAEQAVVPTENAILLQRGAVGAAQAARWSGLGVPLITFGGLDAGDLRAGETVLVSGATGNFGSAAVAVALAMGAARVIAVGRNRSVLDGLVRRFGERVVTVALSGDPDADQRAMRAAADDPIDLVFDMLPPAVGAEVARSAAMTVREYGRVVLMGGVGMLGGDDLALPYPWLMRNSVTVRGQWMYRLDVVPRLLAMVRSGVLDLAGDDVTTFPLDDVAAAVAHAAAHGGPFERTVLVP
ncbi:alcohol dehydrogenase [Jatrophihabitans endophyticus]|uniref:Alcohol dehydrogenase n=1 Tax=Jatrophihabitans endophyticus TaxID=1206085 RepID=A0A1M5SR59_9ACTN|nr:zinc-binding alcohol dehydrogenase family protein [Jatrophihabitans endophyticus]SHH40930.1 alcohol dehydrogenase [Jatrophihabitans endophyticus]